jgi:hypothetical protein
MAYQLQPGLSLSLDADTKPEHKADDFVFEYPKPSSLNCGDCRPSTEVWGTAPYKAQGGAPAHLIDVSDSLRPQATTSFNKKVVLPYERNLYPLVDTTCKLPLRVASDPTSSRSELQNNLFFERYGASK